MEKDIYAMKLHETIQIMIGGLNYRIIRVPGGWLYRYNNDETSVFVLFNNEFRETDNDDADMDSDEKIIINGGDVFIGTREEFANKFGMIASDAEIKDWCFDYGYKLTINNKIIF